MMNLIKSFFLRAFALIVSVVMVLAAGFSTGESYDVRDPENCKLNFSILSDSHIEGNNFPRYKVFTHCLQDVRKNKSGNDAVIFLGDNTMNGQVLENTLFHGAAKMLENNADDIDTMIKKVCSPGGSTIEGVKKLDEADMEQAVVDAISAAYKRNIELGKS